jgi:predicted nucleic acid-binding protein
LPGYFLDTSALANLYHKEAGSDYVERILIEPRSFISRLSIVEMESVFAIKVRTGEIDGRDVELARRCLRADLSQQRLFTSPPVRADHYHVARTLLVRYGAEEGLRTLDALQLAFALDLHRLGLVAVVVAADQTLCRVASLAGCVSLNPERPGPLVV